MVIGKVTVFEFELNPILCIRVLSFLFSIFPILSHVFDQCFICSSTVTLSDSGKHLKWTLIVIICIAIKSNVVVML